MIVILASFEKEDHAKQMAHLLVDQKMAACVSVIPVNAVYVWDDKKVDARECEAFIKTTEEQFLKIESLIRETLGYETPQLIKLSVSGANESYLKWVEEQVQ